MSARLNPILALARLGVALCLLGALAGCSAEKSGPVDKPQVDGPFASLVRLISASSEEKRLETARERAIAAAARPAYITIRFDRPSIVYQDALYSALVRAFDRYPEAEFDVVLAIPRLPVRANPREALARGERHIEEVVLSMTDMGMPSDRLTISAQTDDTADVNEIRIYIR